VLRIISEQTSDIDEELRSSFIDWQKTSGFVNWKKLRQILKGSGSNWHKRTLISKLYVDQSAKI
jgi:hypothetical protein